MDFQKLEKIISSVCISAGYELVEIDIARSKSGDKLIVYICLLYTSDAAAE